MSNVAPFSRSSRFLLRENLRLWETKFTKKIKVIYFFKNYFSTISQHDLKNTLFENKIILNTAFSRVFRHLIRLDAEKLPLDKTNWGRKKQAFWAFLNCTCFRKKLKMELEISLNQIREFLFSFLCNIKKLFLWFARRTKNKIHDCDTRNFFSIMFEINVETW